MKCMALPSRETGFPLGNFAEALPCAGMGRCRATESHLPHVSMVQAHLLPLGVHTSFA